LAGHSPNPSPAAPAIRSALSWPSADRLRLPPVVAATR